MRVVADTGPINYLALIDQARILADLFGGILIPEAVRRELSQSGAPAVVQALIAAPTSWISVHQGPLGTDPALQRLGAGEREGILLAA